MRKLAKGIALGAAAFAVAACVQIPADAAVAAPSISLKEQVGSGQIVTGWTFQYADLQDEQYLYFNVYENNDPQQSETGSWNSFYDDDSKTFKRSFTANWSFSDEGSDAADDTQTTIRSWDLTPGTKTVVAYLYDKKAYDAAVAAYDAAWDAYYASGYVGEAPQIQYPDQEDYYSQASNAITIEVSMEATVSTTVKAKSITMDMNDSNATGYEIYRKVGKKYKKIATVAEDTYKDTGLTAKTWYTYRVRPYYKNPDTGAITYGKYTTFKRMTKGGALKLKAQVQKKKNIKLTWKKVKGAKNYEIYRYNGYSYETEYANGQDDGYGSYTLLKTVGKKKKKYVDKKTLANEDYTYVVRAVMPKKKGVKTDDTVIVEERVNVDLSFGMPAFEHTRTNANGDLTVEWDKVYGVDGYIVMKQVVSFEADGTANYDWKEIGRLGKNATKYTFPAESVQRPDGTYINTTRYDICAYKGNVVSTAYSNEYDDEYDNGISVTKQMGLVTNISAKNVGNGIQISWSPVPGAAYYQVYRVRAGSLVEDKDLGGYDVDELDGVLVTEYVEAQAPVAVDVAALNAAIDAGNRPDGYTGDRLDPEKTYYYQNYQYARTQITGTSMIDYTYDMYEGYYYSSDGNYDASGEYIPTTYAVGGFASEDEAIKEGPEDGVAYQYYVIAYATDADAQDTRYVASATPGTLNSTPIPVPSFDDYNQCSAGCKNIASVNFTSTVKTGKAVIKNVKSKAKKTATIKIKKKVSGASEYKIYRSTKKKGKYMCVGTTKKLTFKDKGLESGKTYYYKVKAVAKNASNADVDSSFSKAKKVRVR